MFVGIDPGNGMPPWFYNPFDDDDGDDDDHDHDEPHNEPSEPGKCPFKYNCNCIMSINCYTNRKYQMHLTSIIYR